MNAPPVAIDHDHGTEGRHEGPEGGTIGKGWR